MCKNYSDTVQKHCHQNLVVTETSRPVNDGTGVMPNRCQANFRKCRRFGGGCFDIKMLQMFKVACWHATLNGV